MKTHVVKTHGDATLAEAADLLDLYQTTGLPIVDDSGALIGMLTESDILRAARTLSGMTAAQQPVKAWMTAPAIRIQESATVEEATALLRHRGLKRLPVVTSAEHVVGVLNRIDLLQAVFEGTIANVFADES